MLQVNGINSVGFKSKFLIPKDNDRKSDPCYPIRVNTIVHVFGERSDGPQLPIEETPEGFTFDIPKGWDAVFKEMCRTKCVGCENTDKK